MPASKLPPVISEMTGRVSTRGKTWTGLCGAVAAAALYFWASGAMAADGFHLDRLPKGKNVTIPRPATTYVPLSARVMLTATDMPQTLSFRSVNLKRGVAEPLRLAIYDRNSERVQYVDVSATTPFLYTFKNLEPISVIVQGAAKPRNGVPTHSTLQVESDKPLDIAR